MFYQTSKQRTTSNQIKCCPLHFGIFGTRKSLFFCCLSGIKYHINLQCSQIYIEIYQTMQPTLLLRGRPKNGGDDPKNPVDDPGYHRNSSITFSLVFWAWSPCHPSWAYPCLDTCFHAGVNTFSPCTCFHKICRRNNPALYWGYVYTSFSYVSTYYP